MNSSGNHSHDGFKGAVTTRIERGPRWQCSPYLSPSCVIHNHHELYGKVCLKVENLSKDGLGLVTDQPIGMLVSGMRLDGAVHFPGLGVEQVKLELRWIKQVSDGPFDVVRLGAKVIKSSPSYLPCVGQYLFQHVREAAITDIWQAGILIQSVASGVIYNFVQSEEDYREVLELRKETYPWVRLSNQKIRLEELGDVYDTRAKILYARHHGKSVGSLRLVFHDGDDCLEMLEHVDSKLITEDFPSKESLVEVTRICICPDFRKGDLMLGMLKMAIVTMLQHGREWMVGGSEAGLLPFYKALGAKATNLKYQWNRGGISTEVTVIIFNVRDFLNGIDVNHTIWELMAPDIITFARNNDIPINFIFGGNPLHSEA